MFDGSFVLVRNISCKILMFHKIFILLLNVGATLI